MLTEMTSQEPLTGRWPRFIDVIVHEGYGIWYGSSIADNCNTGDGDECATTQAHLTLFGIVLHKCRPSPNYVDIYVLWTQTLELNTATVREVQPGKCASLYAKDTTAR